MSLASINETQETAAMFSTYQRLVNELYAQPRRWLVTGAAGFIGSHLVEHLLRLRQKVIGLDNFITGSHANLHDVLRRVGEIDSHQFTFIEGDITDWDVCQQAVQETDYVLHHAALGSVPRSIADPISTHRANVDGFVNLLHASQNANVKRFVYASSSSVYGDHAGLPKIENRVGSPLSPYALTKSINEQYAAVYARVYGFKSVGLRYFNVFGRRQDPAGPYAAVIPKWIHQLLNGEQCVINGDGNTSRDFCHVDNVIQANLLAATSLNEIALNQVYNIAVGEQTTLIELYKMIRNFIVEMYPQFNHLRNVEPLYASYRPGDIRHSLADISKAVQLLGYEPVQTVQTGLKETLSWYIEHMQNSPHD